MSTNGYNLVNDGYSAVSPCINHGTAVASLIGGIITGVAKDAFLWPVRVINCSGGTDVATVVRGIELVLEERTAGPRVANFSFYCEAPNDGDTAALDTAINSLLADGIAVVTSVNNQNDDRCDLQSPARVPGAITVGGTSNNPMDERAVKPGWNRDTACGAGTDCGSNFGACVDVFAPGYAMKTALRHGCQLRNPY